MRGINRIQVPLLPTPTVLVARRVFTIIQDPERGTFVQHFAYQRLGPQVSDLDRKSVVPGIRHPNIGSQLLSEHLAQCVHKALTRAAVGIGFNFAIPKVARLADALVLQVKLPTVAEIRQAHRRDTPRLGAPAVRRRLVLGHWQGPKPSVEDALAQRDKREDIATGQIPHSLVAAPDHPLALPRRELEKRLSLSLLSPIFLRPPRWGRPIHLKRLLRFDLLMKPCLRQEAVQGVLSG